MQTPGSLSRFLAGGWIAFLVISAGWAQEVAEEQTLTHEPLTESVVATEEPAVPPEPEVAAPAMESSEVTEEPEDSRSLKSGDAQVVVIPVRDQIANPILYVLRRGLKEAIENEADLVVLDMDTPGGALNVTFEIMEAISKFDGDTATFVNKEAISAGAFIAAMTDDIYFMPDGVIGAAAPVLSSGGEIDESMKQKIVSYLRARMRAISEGHKYRGEVISAMIDADYELKIEGEVLKEKGELLSLTASEASKTYGDPPSPLLAAGMHDSIEDLLDARFGSGGYEVVKLETTWSEDLAAYLNAISPLLMGLGMLGIFIEFKTPGFGIFGIGGGILMVIVFFGHHVAGLSGNEPMLVFFLGGVLVLLELLFFPGVVVVALSGILMMIGALVWSMVDVWPNQPISFSSDMFLRPITNVFLGMLVAVAGALAILKFLPKGWFWDKMILATALGGARRRVDMEALGGGLSESSSVLVGRTGVAATDMFPSGQVELDGQRYEAHVEVGSVEAGRPVVVRAEHEFGLVVEPVNEEENA